MQRPVQPSRLKFLLLAALATASVAGPVAAQVPSSIAIEPKPLAQALKEFASSTGLQIVYRTELTEGLQSKGAGAGLPVEQTLQQLLRDTGLRFEFINAHTVAIRSAAVGPGDSRATALEQTIALEQPLRLAQAEVQAPRTAAQEAPGADEAAAKGVPEVLVKGSKILNMDIQRSREDTQPYVVFDRQAILQSNAANIEDFLKQRLTMNSQAATYAAVSANSLGARSSVNLRGLGTSQTLILVDGHRLPAVGATSASPTQPDLNGIPLGAIERIEVLPTTASGIYGGGATGGVVNVILRRDYAGFEAKTSFENTVDSDTPIWRGEANAGFSLFDGKSSVLLAGTWTDTSRLSLGDRNFVTRGRNAILQNNPGFFYNSATPPNGATPNIRTANGSNLTLKSTGAVLSAPYTFVPANYPGISSDGGAALAANAGRYNFDLPATAQYAYGTNMALQQATEVSSFMVTWRHQFSSRLQMFFDASAYNNISDYDSYVLHLRNAYRVNASAPNNPFSQDIVVTVPTQSPYSGLFIDNTSRRAVVGVLFRLAPEWMTGFDYTYGRSVYRYVNRGGGGENGTQTTAFATGAVNILRDTLAYPFDVAPYITGFTTLQPLVTTLHDLNLRFSGPIGTLPAGRPRISVALGASDEKTDDGNLTLTNYTTGIEAVSTFVPAKGQKIYSAYVELALPVLRSVEVQLAGRYSRYSIDGSAAFLTPTAPVINTVAHATSFDPTIGVKWDVSDELAFRASYGTGFLTPGAGQLAPNVNSSTAVSAIIDPRRGNASSSVPGLSGGNPGLIPEESKSWSAGAIYAPRLIPGLRLSLDYTRIEKAKNIATLNAQQIVNAENLLPGRITRAPAAVGDPYGVGPITFIDQTLLNLASAKIEAYDLAVNYDRAAFGFNWQMFGAATLQPHYLTQILPGTDFIENVGITSSNPLKFKANAGFTLSRGPVKFGWVSRFFDSYEVAAASAGAGAPTVANQGGLRVASQIYHDLFAGYRFEAVGNASSLRRALDRSEITLGIKNVFNTSPPYDAGAITYVSPYGDARMASYYINLSKQF